MQAQQQQQPQPTGSSGPGLRPCAPQNVGTVIPGTSKPVGTVPPTLRSHSPSMSQLGTISPMAIQQHNRMQFPQQQQQTQQQQQAQQQQQQVQVQAQQQIQQQQQQGILVGPPGPSPNGQSTSNTNMVPNPGLSPFGQPQMSQANLTTTTASNNATTSQFPTSNGTASGLPNSSPIQNQHQFPDLMKVRALTQAQVQAAQQAQQSQPTSTQNQVGTPVTSIPQTPSPFSGMQQPSAQQQQSNQQFPTRPLSASTPNDNGIATSTPQTIPPPVSSGPSPTGGMSATTTTGTTNGPQSTTSTPNTPLVPSLMTPNQTVSSASNQTPPHSGTTPSPAGLASLGKGMTSQERAALNTPRNTSMSSQMAAITAALDRDNSPSPPMNNNKGKLDSIKEESMKMEIKQEPEDPQNHRMDGGKSVNNEINIKTEPKTEPMEEGSNEAIVKEEPIGIKEESMTPISGQDATTSDIKPMVPEPIQPSGTSTDKKKCLFKPDELRQALMPTLEKLYRQDPESIPFRQPVDPQALGIPDYPTIVKKPMDLSTIKKKLDTEKYSDPWEYVDDVWMMFDNAWLYNRKTSRVYRYCTKVTSISNDDIREYTFYNLCIYVKLLIYICIRVILLYCFFFH